MKRFDANKQISLSLSSRGNRAESEAMYCKELRDRDVRRQTSRPSKDIRWSTVRGYKAYERSRYSANNSRCFKCGKLDHLKNAFRVRPVKYSYMYIEEASNISSIASNNSRSYIDGHVSNHKFEANKPMINVLVNSVKCKV